MRWAFKRSNGDPLIAAGLWGVWIGPQGEEILSFTMLTTNADGHPWYGRMHAPGDEKRMPVFLTQDEYRTWLTCAVEEAGEFIKQFPAELLSGEPAPAPFKPLPEPKEWEQEPDMFTEEWRGAADDPVARELAAKKRRPKAKTQKPEEPPGPTTGDLF